jgi:hypothetical protein
MWPGQAMRLNAHNSTYKTHLKSSERVLWESMIMPIRPNSAKGKPPKRPVFIEKGGNTHDEIQ